MSFNDYWKEKADKRRKAWAAAARRFADKHAQLEDIRKTVHTLLNHYAYHDYIESHYTKQNPIALWEQMLFRFSESGLRDALEAEGADLKSFRMETTHQDITAANQRRPEFFPDADERFFKKISTMLTDVDTVRITLGQATMTINRYCTKDSPFGFYGLHFGERLTRYAMLLQETEFNMLSVATLLMEIAAEMELRDEELNYHAKKLRLRTMEAVVADDSIDFTLWDDNKLAKKVEEYIAKGYTINQVIDQVLRPYKTAVKKYFSIATEQSIMTENDTLSDSGGYSNKKYWVENYLRPHLKEAGMHDVDVSVVKLTIVLTKQGYSCCIKNRYSWQDGGFSPNAFSPNAGYDNFNIDISTSTPVSAVVKFLGHMPTINRRVDEYIVKALQIYDNLMCRQNEEYNKIAQHLAALSAQHAGKPVGKLMKYLRWSTGNLMNKEDAFSRMHFHTIEVTGDTSFNFTARKIKSHVPLIYGDELIKEKWVDAECCNVYSADPKTTDEHEWLKVDKGWDRWEEDMRSFAGHSCWDTFLTVDFIDEKL